MERSQILVKNMDRGRDTDMNNLPKDPVLLLSVVNTKLRDFYDSLDTLCEEMEVDKEELIEALKGIDYEYDESRHQFV